MEISAETVKVLTNFAQINSNIVIKPGNKIMTISEAKNILAEAVVQEEFDSSIGIYDLQEFLSVLNLVDTPSVKFDSSYMRIGGNAGRSIVKYFYADPEMLTTPSKPIDMPEADVWFTLDQTTLSGIKKASSIFGHSQVIVEPDDNTIKLSVVDAENATANTYSVTVDGGYNSPDFKYVLNINNLRMVNDDYEVNISKKLISQFTSVNSSITYWVALEKSSTYGE